MRKREYIPWLIIAAVAIATIFYFISSPFVASYSPIVVEITGTMIGFLLAISVTELIKISEKYHRFKELVRGLVKEMRYILSILNDDVLWFDIDMWKMALSSGELGILDNELRDYFRTFYSNAQAVLNMGNVLKTALANNNEKTANEIIEAMKPFKTKMKEIGEIVIE